MSDYLRQIWKIDPCIQFAAQTANEGKPLSGTASLRDFLFSLDGMAHEPNFTSGDGVFTPEEFEYLRDNNLAPALKTFASYEDFSQNIDRYVEQEMIRNPQCACPDGLFEQNEAGFRCMPLFRPPEATVKKTPPPRPPVRKPPPKVVTAPPPPPEPPKPEWKAPEVSREEYDPLPLELPSQRKNPFLNFEMLEMIAENEPGARPRDLAPRRDLPNANHIWNFPKVEKAEAPCKPLVKAPKKIGTAEKIVGAVAVLVPQLGATLVFLNDPGCWGKKVGPRSP